MWGGLVDFYESINLYFERCGWVGFIEKIVMLFLSYQLERKWIAQCFKLYEMFIHFECGRNLFRNSGQHEVQSVSKNATFTKVIVSALVQWLISFPSVSPPLAFYPHDVFSKTRVLLSSLHPTNNNRYCAIVS